ncbi:hypothetical protein QVD17_41980 [Tagetes erecta]|uniref:ADP-ribosyl cyclase/cyclic ADP-ribose hydrolase n=1 Tax=Tagetes erecta TaxID=13708 RepID=A0AAD8JRK1_TARER|nr:hypothetical protein QVD17_41980 [Tagetes erecta]
MEATEEVRIIGICGMGGIGKTTIVQALFRRVSYKFEGSSFVNDVKENSSSDNDICTLQEQILQDVLVVPQMFKIRHPVDGAGIIRSLFPRKSVLLVLDDGKDLEHVTSLIDSFGLEATIGIRILIEKSFITVSNKKLRMHDLIQEMGRKIVRDSFPNSRIWLDKDMHEFIRKKKKLNEIEAIVEQDNIDDANIGLNADVFESMTNLRLLHVYNTFTVSEPTALPNDLRWLYWNEYPFSSMPLDNMPMLVGLEMKFSNIIHLWKGIKIMQNLKIINLHRAFALIEFPNVSAAPNIERLILTECHNLVNVHESLGFLEKLVYMDMRGCTKLKYLPPMVKMQSLETLILDNCYELETLPPSLSSISNLKFLSLDTCLSLNNIPNSIHKLKNLITLCLQDCPKLKKLPEEFGSVEKIEELQIGLPRQFRKIDPLELWRSKSISFHALRNLGSLKKLDLSLRQIGEEDFPENLHGFSALEELNLSGNSKLVHLPTSISHLSSLKHLELNMCGRLKDLHALPSGLEVLKAYGCDSLEKIKDLQENHVCLYKIWLYGCKLLLNNENERQLDKMLEQSFLMNWAAANACVSIATPGSKIPNWFEEQQDGNIIIFKLPRYWQTLILGFVICGVFRHQAHQDFPYTIFRFESYGKNNYNSGLQSTVVEAIEDGNDNVCIGYLPFSVFKQLHDGFELEDWSHIIEGKLVVTIGSIPDEKPIRCAAKVVYKEDVKSIQHSKQYYWNWDLMKGSQTTYLCIDKPMLSVFKKGFIGT